MWITASSCCLENYAIQMLTISSFNIRLTVRSEMPNAMACFAAERWGLANTARFTISTFSGVRTVRAPPGGFFFSAEPVDLKFAIHNKIVFLLGTLP
jgi:hypothetical protein